MDQSIVWTNHSRLDDRRLSLAIHTLGRCTPSCRSNNFAGVRGVNCSIKCLPCSRSRLHYPRLQVQNRLHLEAVTNLVSVRCFIKKRLLLAVVPWRQLVVLTRCSPPKDNSNKYCSRSKVLLSPSPSMLNTRLALSVWLSLWAGRGLTHRNGRRAPTRPGFFGC